MSSELAPWSPAAVVGLSFLALAGLETLRPLRRRTQPRLRRSLRNLATAGLAFAVSRPLQLLALLPFAAWCGERGLGLLRLVEWPAGLETLLALLLLDGSHWYWHRANHRLPFLWRFHSVHHEDHDLDASTALRFHFGELGLAVGWRALQVALVGASAEQVALHAAVLAVSALFHHSNLRLPLSLEAALVRLVVTPRMHGIHHSAAASETNSNYSSLLSLWDRLHGTLRLDVAQAEIAIGLPGPPAAPLGAWRLQLMPFRAGSRPPARKVGRSPVAPWRLAP